MLCLGLPWTPTAPATLIMTGGIAILGWGSLLWDGGAVFDQLHEDWQLDGPSLPLEFSRVSASRGGALTLVIDAAHGAMVQVAWCRSRRAKLADAVADLRRREGTTDRNIGRYAADGRGQYQEASAFAAIRAWATDQQLDGAVWTDLQGNFGDVVGEPFSVDAALRYLARLEGDGRANAITYLRRAPAFVRTPLREAFERTVND
jgi:hypothetical protein